MPPSYSEAPQDYDIDRNVALTRDSGPIRRIREASLQLGADVLFGFLEREGEALYSSCMLVEKREIACCYRRMSRGWKCSIALCGDLWDTTQNSFRLGEELLFWPVYCSYSPEEWLGGTLAEYAAQCRDFAPLTLMVNSPCSADSHGGCAAFQAGRVAALLPPGREGLLTMRPLALMKG